MKDIRVFIQIICFVAILVLLAGCRATDSEVRTKTTKTAESSIVIE